MSFEKRMSGLYPVGTVWTWKKHLTEAAAFMVILLLVCWCAFGVRFSPALKALYNPVNRALIPGTVVPPFPWLMEYTVRFFAVGALCALLTVPKNYLAYFQGSRSIYLMRRLPQRWELARRCIGVPLIAIAELLIGYGISALTCLIAYLLITPAGHLPPDIWARFGG